MKFCHLKCKNSTCRKLTTFFFLMAHPASTVNGPELMWFLHKTVLLFIYLSYLFFHRFLRRRNFLKTIPSFLTLSSSCGQTILPKMKIAFVFLNTHAQSYPERWWWSSIDTHTHTHSNGLRAFQVAVFLWSRFLIRYDDVIQCRDWL